MTPSHPVVFMPARRNINERLYRPSHIALANTLASPAQVNHSVSELEQMTQQNAALVEESTAASESLREQAFQLVGSVEQFKLNT